MLPFTGINIHCNYTYFLFSVESINSINICSNCRPGSSKLVRHQCHNILSFDDIGEITTQSHANWMSGSHSRFKNHGLL